MAIAFRNLPGVSIFRLLAGFALAPLFAGSVMFIIALGAAYAKLDVFSAVPSDPVDGAAALASGVTLIAYMAEAAGALPGLALMIRRGVPLTLRRVLLLGAAVGQLPFISIVAGIVVVHALSGTLSADVSRTWEGCFGVIRATVLGVLIGVPSAGAFWLIGVRRTGLE